MSLSVTSLLKKYNITPKKRLGQHFLAAGPTIEKIVASLEIKKDDIVLEIGPGLGLMTGLIAERAKHVFAVDADTSIIEIAKEELRHHKNITWVNEDILRINSGKIGTAALSGNLDVKLGYFAHTQDDKFKIIGNLPYNISSPIIFWMIENRAKISEAIIMVQKEVAVRLAAKPGNKDYGILSVLLQARADVKKLFDVSAKSFIPPPKVQSSVVRIKFNEDLYKIKDGARFAAIVKGAFGKRRKTLRNALIGAKNLQLDAAHLDEILSRCKIDGKRRPETLTVEEYIMLADNA